MPRPCFDHQYAPAGSESLVFQNAQPVLEEHTPVIFCEIRREYLKALGQSVQDVVSFLTKLGYTVEPVQVEDLNSPSDFDRCSHIHASMNRNAG